MLRAATLLALLVATASACMQGASTASTPDRGAAEPDADVDPCAACTADQQCVALYASCQQFVSCVPRTVDCPDNACSTECAAAYCTGPSVCTREAECGPVPEGAFTCYGP